ncbi:hypothetical protein ACFPOE_11360 [Caenimonas terrae]|uniref:Phage tail assembly protein n=1 Tax=Caenimonas terrae TaxID=696074 RepID=A0ABW0NC26_9BURK
MARKLMVSDTVQVPVTLVLAGKGGKSETHKFHLVQDRLGGEELRKQMASDSPVNEFLAGITKGWGGQKLVVEEDGTPSEFSQEAFADMLTIAGAPAVFLNAYVKEVVAKEKN